MTSQLSQGNYRQNEEKDFLPFSSTHEPQGFISGPRYIYLLIAIWLRFFELYRPGSMSSLEDRENHSGTGQGSHPTSYSSSHRSSEVSVSLITEERRIDSFLQYPQPHNVNLIQLAKCGFMYTNPSPDSQEVTCLGCGKKVQSWNEGDKPNEAHFHESGCSFIQVPSSSGHSSVVSSMAENVVRASVNTNDESTKPFQIASTSNNMEVSLAPAVPTESQSLVPAKFKPNQGEVDLRQTASLPTQEMSYELQIHRRTDRQGRTDHTQIRSIMRQESSQSSRSASPANSNPVSLQTTAQPNILSQPAFYQRQGSSQESIPFHQNRPSSSLMEYAPSISRLENPDSFQQMFANLNMRNAAERLYTFQHYWAEENVFRNIRLLVVCGFYCLGQGDGVECFCCHVVVANWHRNDNPRQRHLELSPRCRFMKGEDCGDTPLPPELRRNMPPSAMQTTTHHSIQSHHSGHSGHSRHSNHSSPYPSLGSNPISHPSLEGAVAAAAVPVAESYLNPSASMPISHLSLEGATTAPVAQSYLHPSASMLERNNLLLGFPCANPANPSMREERARLLTFNNPGFRRNTRLQATNEMLAQAGLYYLGSGDKVKCWNCDGGLMDFERTDNPWVEHAKYFPQCEFLLQQKGPAWVTTISLQNPNVERPILPRRENRVLPNVVSSPTPLPPPPARIEDPQLQLQMREQMLEEGMQSAPVRVARAMGFPDERIREVQMLKIMNSECCYQSSEPLIEALLNPNGEPDSPEQPQGNIIDLPGQTIHIRGGNFVGPTIINGRIYHPTPSDSVSHRRPGRGEHVIMINGRSMGEYMEEAFSDPFFSNPGLPIESSYFMPNPAHVGFNDIGGSVSTRSIGNVPVTPVTAPLTRTSSGSSSPSANSTAVQRLEEMQRERACKVCLANVADILFQPCGHICACSACSGRLNQCPICRARITRYIRTYHA